MEAITPIKVNRNRNYLVVDCWLSWSRLDYRHHYDRRRQFPGQGGYAVAVNRKGRYSMLDEKDLQAIAQLMAQQRCDIMQDVKTLLDTEVQTKFNLLAEGQEEILRRMPSADDLDISDGRLDTLEAIARKHSREIEELKKAQ